jgi:phosphopantothenoylcysteine synthetase/decarboxylase
MKCIVTAGPTYEELDEVRRLTNFSTGALGTELAGFLAGCGHEVELLRGHYSTCSAPVQTARLQTFTTTADLRERLTQLAATGAGAVFHAAAVSDFGFGKIWTRAPDGSLEEIRSPKIPTRHGVLLAELRPTPKILPRLRQWFPAAFLAGWKFELDGSRPQAIARAEQQVAENLTNACILNGRAYGAGFGLVTAPGQCRHLSDKPELFRVLESILRAQSQFPPEAKTC